LNARLLPTLIFTIFLTGAVDIFMDWYRLFLKRRGVKSHLNLLIRRVLLVLLAFVFWRPMAFSIQNELSSTHFLFSLFVFCFYSLIATFFKESSPQE